MTIRSSSLEERSPAFTYGGGLKGRTLRCEQVDLEQLARQFGTPLYVYSANALRKRVECFQQAFRHQSHTICYSVKANSNLSLLKLLASIGCGFDIVSGGELQRVTHANRLAAAGVVYSGVGKTADEIDLALKAGILLFNVESEGELELLAERATTLKKSAHVGFRVNPDVKAETHPYICTGLKQNKFGVPIEHARELYRKASTYKYLDPIAVSVHIGSQITDLAPYAEAMDRVLRLIDQLREDGLNICFVDAGGGLGINYQEGTWKDFVASVKEWAKVLTKPLKKKELRLLIEPGRSIIAPTGALVVQALFTKENGGKKFLITDGAMNDLIRPSLYGAHHAIVPVTPRESSEGAIEGAMDIVGPICESGDFLAKERHMPPVAAGDLLAVLDAGAYGMSQASNYNSRPRPAEVLVDKKSVKLIRRRETIEDLVRSEI